MKRLLFLFILLFSVLFTVSVIAQEVNSLRKGHRVSYPEKIQKLVLDPLPIGTYSIGTGGYFPTIDSAFKKLSIDGIAGAVTLELIDDLYAAPVRQDGFLLDGPIPGAGTNSRVTIKPTANKNVTIEGDGLAVLSLSNASYVIIDGIELTGATTLTIHSLKNAQFPWNDGIDFLNNPDHNVIQNTTFICEDYAGFGTGISFTPDFNSAPDSNLIQNNFIKKAGYAIYVVAHGSSVKAIGNIIRGNSVGSETDSLIGWGIQLEFTQNTIIENNVIQNVREQGLPELITMHGINSYFGNGDIIRNNIIHNIHSKAVNSSTGILLSGNSGEKGINNQVYNNTIYDIQCTSNQSVRNVAGIIMWYQNNPKIYYNSVYLTGIGNGANPLGSAALYIDLQCTNVEAKNNIFVNTRDESPYYASAIYDRNTSNLTSDYNDLYSNNYLVRVGSTNYNTLTGWQATGQDLNSITEIPNFIEPDLHINSFIATNIESHGTPIIGIETDYDGEPRDLDSTDIGADEFSGIVLGVDEEETFPSQFLLTQNYPNPFNSSSIIKYSIPKPSQVTLKIFNTLGEEIEVLVNEEKSVGTYELTWNASSLPSGVYFYQLKAGDYVQTRKMILLK